LNGRNEKSHKSNNNFLNWHWGFGCTVRLINPIPVVKWHFSTARAYQGAAIGPYDGLQPLTM
jgi:hypothetical protein